MGKREMANSTEVERLLKTSILDFGLSWATDAARSSRRISLRLITALAILYKDKKVFKKKFTEQVSKSYYQLNDTENTMYSMHSKNKLWQVQMIDSFKASTVFMLVKHKIKLAKENLRYERLSIMHLILANDNLCQKIV